MSTLLNFFSINAVIDALIFFSKSIDPNISMPSQDYLQELQ